MARRLTPLARAAEGDDRLALLKQLRSRLVDAIDECVCTRDLEPLTRRLNVVSQEIDDILGSHPSNSPADVIAPRREQRRRSGGVVAYDRTIARGGGAHG
jgi:hypothetical protein